MTEQNFERKPGVPIPDVDAPIVWNDLGKKKPKVCHKLS